MSPENGNGDILSSWKEISAYLKCGVRSCIRWEKERGLPVHRIEGPRGARVFANKGELDAWREKQLYGGGETAAARVSNPGSSKRLLPVFFSLAVLVISAALILFIFKNPSGPKPFRMGAGTIVTAEPDGLGRLRVWARERSGTYKNVWGITSSKANTVHHSALVAGDFDGDGRAELAVPAAAKVTFTKGERQSAYFKIFINVYRQGAKGIWKTTFFSDGDCAWEVGRYSMNQILAANTDEDPASEIILKTAGWLATYDYDRTSGQIRMSSAITAFVPNANLVLAAAATANDRPSGPCTIIVSGNEMPESGPPLGIKSGWLFFIELEEKGLKIVRSVPIDARLTPKALNVGDVDHDGRWEVLSTAYRTEGDRFRGYLIGWNAAGEKIVDLPIPDSESDRPSYPPLAVADLTFDAGDDILVGNSSNMLFLYSWRDGRVELLKKNSPPTEGIILNTIAIGSTEDGGPKDIVLGGSSRPARSETGRFYLEVLGFDSFSHEFVPKWKRVGGAKDETEVWAAIIAGK